VGEGNPSLPLLANMIGIVEPFYIENTQLDTENFIINFYLSTLELNLFTSPCCNEPNCKINSYVPRKVRILDIINYQTILYYKIIKFKCNKCGKFFNIDLRSFK
jgi:transposase